MFCLDENEAGLRKPGNENNSESLFTHLHYHHRFGLQADFFL
jgi:hypothetical protein